MCVCSAPNCCNILTSVKIIKEMPGSVASGTPCILLGSEWDTLYNVLLYKIELTVYYNMAPVISDDKIHSAVFLY